MENSELKNRKNGWVRNFLFGKRAKNPSPTKITCNCCKTSERKKNDKTVQTNIYLDKDKQLNINTYGKAKKIQQNRECPGKVFPMEQRGCGFHLYFCIDNGRKSDLAKERIGKKPNYVRRNIGNSFKTVDLNNRNFPGDRETGGSAETLQANRSFSPVKNPRTASNTKTNMTGKEVSSRQTPDSLPELTMKKVEENDKENRSIITQRTFHEENLKTESILRIRKTSSNISLAKEPSCKPIVRISSVIQPIHPEIKKFKNEDSEKNQTRSYETEDEIFKEYEVLRKQNLGRKTTMKSRTRSTFVRNSLISMRKEKYSLIETMIPQIFSKLCDIEEIITEWETVCGDKGKKTINIEGISCNNAKSRSSINIKSQESKDNVEKESSPNTSKTNLTVVKAQPEDIFNASENIFIVSEKMRRNQLIYHNTQELDAHRITSNSFNKSMKNERQKKKSDKKIFPQSQEVTKNQVADKWKRISEELKI